MQQASYGENAAAKPLSAAMMPWFWKHYLRDARDRTDVFAAPLLADESELAKLPPAIVITAEIDPLRDEGEAYAAKLQHAGVKVQAKRYDGVTHEFFGLTGLVSEAKDALDLVSESLHHHFHTEPPPVHSRPFI